MRAVSRATPALRSAAVAVRSRPGWLERVRLGGLPALLAALTLQVAVSGLGDTPDTRDSTREIAAWFEEHRTDVFVSVVLFTLGALLLGWFAVRVRDRLAAAGFPELGTVALVGTLLGLAVLMCGMVLMYAALAYVVGAEAPESAKALFELSLVATPVLALPLATLPGAAAWAVLRTGVAPRWFGALSTLAAVLLAIPSVGFARSGFLSPDVGQQILFATLSIWLLIAGLLWPAPAEVGDA
jgi:hypothetical protein